MLRSGASYQQIIGAIGCSRPTIAKIKKRIDAAASTEIINGESQ